MADALAATGLTKRFGERVALAAVDLRIAQGSRVALLGPNGSGKSTFFRIAATLLAPDAGTLAIFGNPSLAAARRALGVVFQNPSLDGKLSVLENLCYAGRLYGLSRSEVRSRALAALERFGILERARDRVETLSGGQKRRVEIAKALLHRPRMLLLDEPSTGLDPQARRDLAAILKELWHAGTTLVLTTHLLDEAEGFDDVVILDRGRVVARGEPRALKAAIGGGVIRIRGKDLVRIGEVVRTLSLDPTRIGDELRVEGNDAAEIERIATLLLRALHGLADSIEIGSPSLEDVFARATGRAFQQTESAA